MKINYQKLNSIGVSFANAIKCLNTIWELYLNNRDIYSTLVVCVRVLVLIISCYYYKG